MVEPRLLQRRERVFGEADAGGDAGWCRSPSGAPRPRWAPGRRAASGSPPDRPSCTAPSARASRSTRSQSSVPSLGTAAREVGRVVAKHAVQRAAIGELEQQPERRSRARSARTSRPRYPPAIACSAPLQTKTHDVSSSPVVANVRSRSAVISAIVAVPVAALHDLAGAAVELDHAFGVEQHVRILRGLPLQAEAAADRGRRRRARTSRRSCRAPHSVSAMASFICHSTSSLNCRISSARSCSGAGGEVVEREGQAELHVAPRVAHAALEVLRPAGSIQG